MPDVATPHGQARVTEHEVPARQVVKDQTGTAVLSGAAVLSGTAVLLHGAGTDTDIPLLVGLAEALASRGVRALRVDQPYVLGKRRPPAPAPQLDAVVRTVLAGVVGPVVIIGRSSGSRVACRISAGLAGPGVGGPDVGGPGASGPGASGPGASGPDLRGIVALGFPLRPLGREPARAVRAAELAGATVPVLVLQGSRDTFGTAADVAELGLPGVVVHAVAGADHGFGVRRKDGRDVAEVAAEVVEVVVPVVLGWLSPATPTVG